MLFLASNCASPCVAFHSGCPCIAVVREQVSTGKLPLDPTAVYLLLTSSEVLVGDNMNGFCGFSGYCGWHNTVKVKGKTLQYGFIGDPTQQCNAQCGHNQMLRYAQ